MAADQSPSPSPVVAVGAVVLNEDHMLMVQRGTEPAKGLWTLPGGKVRAGERLADAVVREVLEETGIQVTPGELLGAFEVISDEQHYVILDHLATQSSEREPVAASDAAAARWVPLHAIAALPHTPRLLEMLTAWGLLDD